MADQVLVPKAKYTVTLSGNDWSVAKYGVVEYLRTHRFMRACVGLTGAIAGLIAPLWWAGFRPSSLKWAGLSAASPVFIEMFIALPLLWMATVSGPNFELVFAATEQKKALNSAEKQFSESKKPEDAVQLDFTRLNNYYAINQSQARSSFRWALFAMFLGFGTIVSGIWIFYFRVPHPDKFMASLSTASGLVVSFLSSVFLWMYGKTQDRSLHYYEQLSRLQRVSLAIRLIGDHSDAKLQSDARSLVIRQLLGQGDTTEQSGTKSQSRGLDPLG